MDVIFKRGLGSDSHYYIDFGGLVLVVSRSSLFRLGLAFYHVAVGNWEVGPAGGYEEIPDCCVVVISSKSSVSSNHQEPGQTPTLHRLVTSVVFDTRVGDLAMALVERWLGLAVVQIGDL